MSCGNFTLHRETVNNIPAPSDVWKKVKIDMDLVDRLAHGETIRIRWRRPFQIIDARVISPDATEIKFDDLNYEFRLEWHYRDGCWYIDGRAPDMHGWVPVAGPIDGPRPHDHAPSILRQMLLDAMSKAVK